MNDDDFHIGIIGGGIHGVGVAQASAAAGYRTILLEQQALAAGTSSRSSKLIHGGLRYLESGQFSLVRESLRERRILLRIAPELVHPVRFYIPVYRTTRRRPWQIRAGLSLYALLAGLHRRARFQAVPRDRWPHLDGLKTEGLQQVFRYWDAQTDDRALTQAVMHSAISLGAVLKCPARFISAERNKTGYEVRYAEAGQEKSFCCQTLVNAGGPWASDILDRVHPAVPKLPIELVQGAHIIVDGGITNGVYYLEAPSDRRAVFAMPWNGNTLVGTTEHRYQGNPATVHPLPEEIAYLLDTLHSYFPEHSKNVIGSFAGLRVLPRGPGRTFYRTRETILHRDDKHALRLLTIYGGKLTGYRATAAKVIALLRPALPTREAVADTTQLRLTPPP